MFDFILNLANYLYRCIFLGFQPVISQPYSAWPFLEFLGLGGGGGLQKPPPPLHKSESVDAIDMKLGGWVQHY